MADNVIVMTISGVDNAPPNDISLEINGVPFENLIEVNQTQSFPSRDNPAETTLILRFRGAVQIKYAGE